MWRIFQKGNAQRWAFDAVSDHDLDEAAHYCRYAFAAYGYLLYIWAQPQYKSASLHHPCFTFFPYVVNIICLPNPEEGSICICRVAFFTT